MCSQSLARILSLGSLLTLLLVILTPLAAAPIPDWAIKARIANMEPDIYQTEQELDALVAQRKAENVSVLELDPGFSDYLNDAEFTARVDLVRRVTEKAHANGMKTVVYITSLEVNTINGETLPSSMFKDHPDWVQRGFSGEPAVFYGSQEDWVDPGMESAWLSPNSGYRDYFLTRLQQLAGSGVDGIWIDVPVYYGITNTSWGGNEPGAAVAFKQWSIAEGLSNTGYSLPTGINWDDAKFKAWIRWRHENIALFIDDVRQTIQTVNPDILLIDEVFPVDNMDSTSTGLDQAWRKSQDGHLAVWEVDSVSNTLGMQWSTVEDFTNKITMYKWTRGMDRNNPSWAFVYGNQELDAGLVMGASVTAGVAPFEAKTPDMTVSVGSQFRQRWFGFIGDNDEALLNTPRSARTAVWYSAASRDYQDFKAGGGYGMYNTTPSPNNDPDWWGDDFNDTPLPKPHLGGYRGAAYGLSKLNIPYKVVVDPGEPSAQLQGVKFLWLPSVAAISDSSAEVIKQFVRDGGVVFATGKTPGTMDEKGNARAQSIFKDLFNLADGVPAQRANINFSDKGGVAIYRPDILGKEFFPFDAGIQLANENLADLEQIVRNHVEDFLIVKAPQQGVHVEVGQASATKHYLYVLNYSGLKLPVVANPQTINLQYHTPAGYKVASAKVMTPDADGDSGNIAVARTAEGWYGMDVKVGQFALIELTLQTTSTAVEEPFPTLNWASPDRKEAAESALNFILNKMRHADKPAPYNAGVYTNLLNNGGLTEIYAHGHHVSAEHMGLTLRVSACMANQSAWEQSRQYIDKVMADPLYKVVNWAVDRDRSQPLVSYDDEWLNANAPLDDFRVIRGLLDGERAFGAQAAGVAEAKTLAHSLLTGMYHTSVTDRNYPPQLLFPAYPDGIVGYAWDWSGTTDASLNPPAITTSLGRLSIDPIPVDYNDLFTMAAAAERNPRWHATLQEATDLLLASEVPAVPGLYYNGLQANGQWTGDFENRDNNQGKHLKTIQVLWIALHLANASQLSDDLLPAAKRQQAAQAAARTLAFFKTYYQANQRIPEYFTMSGQDVAVCSSGNNTPDGCLVPIEQNLLDGEARIYAQVARLALLLNDKPFASQLITAKIMTDRISHSADPRYGQIGVSTASDNDAEAWNVLESALTLCLEAQAGGGTANQAPQADSQSVSVSVDTPQAITLTGSDPEGAALVYLITQQPAHGNLSGTAPNLSYVPAAGYSGTDSFSFTVNDGQVSSAEATVTLTINGSGGNTGVVSNPNASITIDGALNEWSGLQSFGTDQGDVSGAANKLDWAEAWMADDSEAFYLAYRTTQAIETSGFWGYQAYLDTDESQTTGYRTGAVGADFLFEGHNLWRYTGTGTNWSWEYVGAATFQVNGQTAEFSLPVAWLNNTEQLRLMFWGNNIALGGDATDVFPNGAFDAAANVRYFTYKHGDSGSNTNIMSNPVSAGFGNNWADWDALPAFAADPQDMSGDNNPIDWNVAKMAHSANDFHLLLNLHNDVRHNSSGFWGYQAYVDTDEQTSTGLQVGSIGADLLIEGYRVWRYTGDGTSWSWAPAGGGNGTHVSGKRLAYDIPRSFLDGNTTLRMILVGNNAAFSGDRTDVYPDAGLDSSANAYLRYQLAQ